MQPATLDSFLRPYAVRYKRGVPIPIVGLVTLASVNESQRQAIIKFTEQKGNADKGRARWFVETVHKFDASKPDEPNPPRMFSMEHIPALSQMDSAISAALMAEINKHCWPDAPDVESLEKNSETTTTGDSPSS